MKSIMKKLAISLLICILALSVFVLVACDKDAGVYTVKVVDAEGNPYTSALVQLCKVEPNGSLSTCYNGVATDAQGVATLTIGKEIPDTDVDEMEVHLLNLPVYLTSTAVRMHKNETVTVTVTTKLLQPESGTGTGSYSTDKLGNERLTIDPYVVGEGAYALKFTSADQLIYFEFCAEEEGIYKVYSVGNVDASVTQLLGSMMSGINNPHEDSFKNDNVSDADKNFYYEFEVTAIDMDQGQGYASFFFEIALENAEHVNLDSIIVFEYLDEYVEEPDVEVVDVKPAKTPSAFADYNDEQYTFVDAALDGEFKYGLGDDGYYHVGTKDSSVILVACLGQDPELNKKHQSTGYAPRGYDVGFTVQYREKNQPLTAQKGKVAYNYYPLVEAYAKASNSHGRYGVTEELKNFLDAYINDIGGTKNWVEGLGGVGHLPQGDEWLWACGYYEQRHEADGSAEYPYTIEAGTSEVSVPAGGSVYYSIYLMMKGATLKITSSSTNVSFKWYNAMNSSNPTTVESNADGFICEMELEAMNQYYFVFSTKDKAAANFTITVEEGELESKKGSVDNPIEITELEYYHNEVEFMDAVFYTYTVKAGVTKLYFDWDENTSLQINIPSKGIYWTTGEDMDKILQGISVEEGVEIEIVVGTVNWAAGEVGFTISDAPIVKAEETK